MLSQLFTMHIPAQLSRFSLAWLMAQTGQNAGENARDLLAEITTGKVTQAVVVIVAAYGTVAISDNLLNWLSEKVPRQFRLNVKQSLPLWRALVLLLAIVYLVNLFLNLSPNNVLALTGTVAVALGFAFKDYASSVIAGIIAIFEVPYQVGDRIQIGEDYGEVISYGLRGIRIRTPSDNIVTIPHNKIWTDAISNANKGALEAQVVTDIYFDHGVDIELVTRILYRVAQTSKYTQLKLPILVVIEDEPWATHFKLKSYPMDARDEFIYKTDLLQRAKKTFAAYGLLYPSIKAYGEASELKA